MSDKKFKLINSKLTRRPNPPKINFDGRNDLSDLEKQLSQEQKTYIDNELFCEHNFLDKIDAALKITKEDKELAKNAILSQYAEVFESYLDMQKTGTTKDRAKFILLKNLRDTLTKLLILGVTKNEHTDTNEITKKQ